MTYLVNITSQGQISIPAKVRQQMGFDKTRKALLRVTANKIELTPSTDILELKGIFATKRKLPYRQTRAEFEQALSEGRV